jgi:acetyltransferase-like isoleucine patch superfamily enzyme
MFFKVIIQLLVMPLPMLIRRILLRYLLGWSIGARTKIGCSIILADSVSIGQDCRMGHFNIFRGLKILEIGNGTVILNLNHIMARKDVAWPREFRIGDHSQITSRHFFDSGGIVQIGNLCCIGGRDSQIWTHSLLLRADGLRALEWRRLVIDDRCYLGARVTLVHCRIPSDCVVGAGAVVTKDFTIAGSCFLLAGNPARIKKLYPGPLIVAN